MSDLKKLYRAEMERIKMVIEKMDWQDPEFYCEWMAQTYFYSSYSTRIIGLAACSFPLERNALHLRFMEHAREEKNHEKILITDLKEQGRTIQDYSCFASTAALYRTQYYWIQNVAPLAVYGYFLFLEGIAVEHGRMAVEKARQGNPEKSLKFLKVHVEEDAGHVDAHFEKLGEATPAEVEWIRENMLQTADYYIQMVNEITAKVAARRGARKSA